MFEFQGTRFWDCVQGSGIGVRVLGFSFRVRFRGLCLGFGYCFSGFRGSRFSFGVWHLGLSSGFKFGFRFWSTESSGLGLGVWVLRFGLGF